MLKSLLLKSSVLDPVPPSDSNILFISHDIIQSTDVITLNNQIIQQNHFLAQTDIVLILNIPETAMNSGLKTRLLAIPSAIDREPTYLTESFGKWLVVVNNHKNFKHREK